jgi:hypothetical protein
VLIIVGTIVLFIGSGTGGRFCMGVSNTIWSREEISSRALSGILKRGFDVMIPYEFDVIHISDGLFSVQILLSNSTFVYTKVDMSDSVGEQRLLRPPKNL